MKKFIRNFINVFTDILLIVAIVILVLSGYTAYRYKEDPANAYLFDHKPILVLTGSMEPTMQVNSICIAQKTTYDAVKVGDIIMYEIDDKLITHRVIDITEEGIRTKGDNNNTEDSYYITENNLKAKVVYIANWTAGIIKDFQTTEGKIKLIGFPLFVILVLGGLIAVIKKILNTPDEEPVVLEVLAEPENKEIKKLLEMDENSPPTIITEETQTQLEDK